LKPLPHTDVYVTSGLQTILRTIAAYLPDKH